MAAEKDNISVKWFRTMDHLTPSKDISFSICNEFFDALPIHQFEFDENSKKWLEVLVDLEPTRKGSKTLSNFFLGLFWKLKCMILRILYFFQTFKPIER